MKFKINLTDTNGNFDYIVYDQESNVFIKNNEILKFNDIDYEKQKKKVAISLGFSCNMKCSYCIQSKTKKEKMNISELDIIIKDLMEEDLKDCRIEFWGGEPLLYMDEIRYIVSKLGNTEYLVITNGTLLTVELAKFFVDNNFSCVLSHDGTHQDIRGIDPLKNKKVIEAIAYIRKHTPERFSVNTVLTYDNLDTGKRLDFFNNSLGDIDNLNHSGEGLVYNSNFILKNEKDLDDLHNKVYFDLLNGDGLRYGNYVSTIKNFMNIINKSLHLSKITTKCGIENKNYYKVVSSGKQLTCHNFDYNFDILGLHDRDKCKDCLVASLCKGGCPAIPNNSTMFEENCKTSYAFYSAIFRYCIYILTGNMYQVNNIETLNISSDS
jgi:uncharacterized protein